MTFPALLSLNTSNSISDHPFIDFSIRHSLTGDKESPRLRVSINSFSLATNPPPVPPKVYAGLITSGYPIFSAAFLPSSRLVAISDSIIG